MMSIRRLRRRVVTWMKMIDFSIWESRSLAVNNFIRHCSFDITDFVIISVIGFVLVILSLLGFGFFLWYLKTSNEHTQRRLLNILNGYLSAVCMIFSPAVLNSILHLQRLPTKIYVKDLPENELPDESKIIARLTITLSIAISAILLLISIATVLNHFKPGLYLDISLNWRHKIAIPIMVTSFILIEYTLHTSCAHSDTIFKVFKREAFKMKTMVMIPATAISFLCQITVVVDDVWGWKHMYNTVRRCLRPKKVTPINNGDIKMVDLSAAPGQELYQPAHSLHHHAEFVSLTTCFMTLCLFNMIVLLITLLTALLEIFNFIGPGLAWLVAMAVTPTIWITRNKKMLDKIKEIFLKWNIISEYLNRVY